MRTIDILGFEHAQLLDITGPLQVFATANEELGLLGKAAAYQVRLIAKTAQITTHSGLTLASHMLPDDQEPVDTLIVSGGRGVNVACLVPFLWNGYAAHRHKPAASVLCVAVRFCWQRLGCWMAAVP